MAKNKIKRNLRNDINTLNIKVDMYQANPTMGVRVRDFVVRKLMSATINAMFDDAAEVYRKRIETYSDKSLVILPQYQQTIPQLIKDCEESINVLDEARKEQQKEEGKFSFTPADRKLYEDWSNASTDALAYKAIINWFGQFDDQKYHFAEYLTKNKDAVAFLKMLDTAMGGETDRNAKELSKNLVNGNEVTEVSKLRTQTPVIKAFYSKLFDFMTFKGTMKKTLYPEYLQDYLTRKEEQAKALKEQAKALKKQSK